ncbi:pitrilysin family protein [Elizabethkingia sp. JS20170427COW]|uniref:M16 family metallopeptidase n=1 Tax=Elizabethkingia sp. JS20170427COW TaxID=2583851 RepID=UPI0011104FC7|nr:pitrilysin family protein [Elizabethkingia sp. JS20170427COW]QCX54283.1 insulinase family protein [Elizabethkingia sp. JS20170427COW]
MKKQITYIAAAFLFSGLLSAQKIDINKMPTPGPTPTINISKPITFQLKNGLTVMVVENHKLPKVNISLSMDNPPIYEGKIVGVSSIMAQQLDKGTKNISKDEFNKKVDFLGANLNFNSRGASANTLSKYFPEVMALMADAIVNPQFKAQEIQDSKERAIESLKTEEKSAQAIASKVNNALIYGKNTALGEFETEESIKNIQPTDVEKFYQENYIPNNAYLVVVGDVKAKEVKKMAEKLFANWKKANTQFSIPAPAHNLAKTEVNIVDVPTAVQSIINIGNVTTLKMKDPNYFAATLANYILGGGGEARLFMNLREKNGFTYGAYSSISTSKYSPSFTAEASVRNEVTAPAVTEFMNELKGISTVKTEELESAKAKLKGSFIMSLERPETIARFALTEKTQGLPKDFYPNYLKSIDGVSQADISKAVAETILPNQSRIFIAGKAADIADSVEKLGYPVTYYDRDANKVAKPEAKKVDANVTIESVGQNYIKAIGGETAVSKIKSLTIDAKAKVQGMDMDMTMIQAQGAKMMMDIKMMGNTVQKIVFDGKDGYMMVQGQKMPFPAEQKTEMAEKKDLFPELNFGKNKEYTLSGIEKFNDEDAYLVKNDKSKLYYSVKTGLKIGEVQVTKQGDIPTTYSDYKEVSGIKQPFKISQNMGGMEIVFNVASYKVNQAKDSDFK